MRRSTVICVLMMSLLLAGCGTGQEEKGPVDRVLAIRGQYLAAGGCTAALNVMADYGQRGYYYTMDVTVSGGQTLVEVTAPAEVAGITACLDEAGGSLVYDGTVLETGMLSDDGLTPLSSVPALLEQVRSGFIASCASENLNGTSALRVLCRDPVVPAGTGQETTLWFDTQTHGLIQGEITVDGRRVVLCEFIEFFLT